jgi:hypothetical protein
LRNSRERLRLLFGERAQLELRQDQAWVEAHLRLPLPERAA